MLNEVYKISERLEGSVILSWTSSDANNVSWVFVNGRLIHGHVNTGEVARQVPIRFSRDLNKMIEIHEFLDDDNIEPNRIVIREFQRPTIEWDTDPEAIYYRVYHTAFGEAEELMATVQLMSTSRYTMRTPTRLVEGWHYFRVESVNEFGIESTRQTWRYRAFRIPKPVNGLDVANGSGANLFDIVIN